LANLAGYTNYTKLNAGTTLAVGGVAVTSTAAELNIMDGVTATAAELNRGSLKKATGALAAADTGGGVFAWQNPAGAEILVELVKVIVTTKTTGACSLDVGMTATNATTLSDTLIDGQDINAAVGTFDNWTNKGTNGIGMTRVASGKWITGSVVAGGASAGLVGTYEIYYRVL
jgi:hypothetical protein